MKSTKVAIVIPTYNEAENLPKLIESLEGTVSRDDLKIIIVDDSSPDGTADIADKLNSTYGNILTYRRTRKLGIGSAITDGINLALDSSGAEFIVTMDADFSHDPLEIPRLISEAEGIDLIQGSRYVAGGKIVGWSIYRRFISLAANILYGKLLETKLHEHTTYFRVYSRRCAQTIALEIKCSGYEFGIVSILLCLDRGYTIKEVPITFTDRTRGKSKLKVQDLLKGVIFVSRTFLSRSLQKLKIGK